MLNPVDEILNFTSNTSSKKVINNDFFSQFAQSAPVKNNDDDYDIDLGEASNGWD